MKYFLPCIALQEQADIKLFWLKVLIIMMIMNCDGNNFIVSHMNKLILETTKFMLKLQSCLYNSLPELINLSKFVAMMFDSTKISVSETFVAELEFRFRQRMCRMIETENALVHFQWWLWWWGKRIAMRDAILWHLPLSIQPVLPTLFSFANLCLYYIALLEMK